MLSKFKKNIPREGLCKVIPVEGLYKIASQSGIYNCVKSTFEVSKFQNQKKIEIEK